MENTEKLAVASQEEGCHQRLLCCVVDRGERTTDSSVYKAWRRPAESLMMSKKAKLLTLLASNLTSTPSLYTLSCFWNPLGPSRLPASAGGPSGGIFPEHHQVGSPFSLLPRQRKTRAGWWRKQQKQILFRNYCSRGNEVSV